MYGCDWIKCTRYTLHVEEAHFWKNFMQWSRINCHWDEKHEKQRSMWKKLHSGFAYLRCSTLECTHTHMHSVAGKKLAHNPKKRSIFKCFNNFVRKTFLINCRAEIYLSICIKCIKNYCVCKLCSNFHTDDDDISLSLALCVSVPAKAIKVFILRTFVPNAFIPLVIVECKWRK